MTSLPQEVAALREAVNNLANRAELTPRYREPDAKWTDKPSQRQLPEWFVSRNLRDGSRFEWRVRSGYDDGIAAVYLVDNYGDMHAMTVPEAHRLIEALSAAVLHVNDEVSARRARRSS